MAKGYTCACCGEYFDEIPMGYGLDAPHYWDGENENSELTPDWCVVENEYFFVKALIEIPVHGEDESFSWDIWVSLSETNFKIVTENWGSETRQELPPMFGWISSQLPDYPDMLRMKAKVQQRTVGLFPTIELEPTDHPLAVEQREGINMSRVTQFAEQYCENKK